MCYDCPVLHWPQAYLNLQSRTKLLKIHLHFYTPLLTLPFPLPTPLSQCCWVLSYVLQYISDQEKLTSSLGGEERAAFKRNFWISCWSTKNVALSQQVLSGIAISDKTVPQAYLNLQSRTKLLTQWHKFTFISTHPYLLSLSHSPPPSVNVAEYCHMSFSTFPTKKNQDRVWGEGKGQLLSRTFV